MSASLPTLALRVAVIRRQAQALITSLATASVQRAFTMIEWDENKHPRGPNGKFIGGAGLQAERDAFHLGRAKAHFARATQGLSETEAAKRDAHFTYRYRTDEALRGVTAVARMQRIMQQRAQAGAAETAHDPIEAHRLAYLRQAYATALERTDLPDETRMRLMRESSVIDRYLQRLDTPGDATRLPAAEKAAIDAQLAQTLAKERTNAEAVTPATPTAPITSTSTPLPIYDVTRTITLLGVERPDVTGVGGHTGYNEATFAAFWRHISGNPRSAIDARIVLAPQVDLPRKNKLAEQARRDSSPIYKTMMEKGEVSWDGKDGHTYLLRRRYNLLTQLVNYDLFVDGKTQPSPYANLQWQNQQAYDLIQQFS